MTDKELLDALKAEALLAQARAKGALAAYIDKKEEIDSDKVHDMGIYRGRKISVKFTNGIEKFIFSKIKYFYPKKETWLYGTRILKSGKLSKDVDWLICDINYLDNVTVIKEQK